MRRLILFVALAFCTMSAFSQISIGVIGGYTLSKQTPKRDGADVFTPSYFSAWHAGMVAETRIAGAFYVQPQLLLSRKGIGEVYDFRPTPDIKEYRKTKLMTTYLELPLNVVYKFKAGFFAGAGPYAALALKGKARIQSSGMISSYYPSPDYTTDIVYSNERPDGTAMEYQMRAWDFGVNVTGGYNLNKHMFVSMNCSQGLRSVYFVSSGFKNRYLGISAGYYFN